MTEMKLANEKPVSVKKRRLRIAMPPGHDRLINGCVWWLAIFGLLMIASASMGLAVNKPMYLPFTVAKQAVFLTGGFVAMRWAASSFSISFLRSERFPLLAIGVGGALISCVIFGEVNGARAWIRVPISSMDISIQPSEFAKIMIILIIAAYCGDVKRTYTRNSEMWRAPLVFICAYLFIVLVIQKDLGSMAVMAIIAFVCVEIPSHPALRKMQNVLLLIVVLAVGLVIFLLSPWGEGFIESLPLTTYQVNRFLSAVNPFADRYNTGYQLINGLISFASGGWTGLGFGNSVRKYTNFPAANTDFILAIIVEELGFVGFLMVFIPYFLIVMKLIMKAIRMKSEKGRIILIGVAMYIVIHCVFNIGGVTGLIPLTGVPLPMISAGGSSTFSLMLALGIAQAVIIRYNQGEIE